MLQRNGTVAHLVLSFIAKPRVRQVLRSHGVIKVKTYSINRKPKKSSNSTMVYGVKDEEDFKTQLKEAGEKLVVVDFYATWCGPCKMIAPKLEVFAQEMPQVVFLKVDVDEVEEVASEYNITAMPTFVFFKSGKKIDDFSGASEEKLKDMIARHK